MRKLSLFTILAVTIIFFVVSACFGADDKTIKIGAANSLTGWMAAGENLTNEGIQLAVDWINGNGGIKVKGVPYKLHMAKRGKSLFIKWVDTSTP